MSNHVRRIAMRRHVQEICHVDRHLVGSIMCRFVLYLGPAITLDVLTTKPTNSIIHQSHHSRLGKEPLNGDGFGLVWYVPDISPEPAQYRSIQPAWSSVNLLHLARVCRSEVILAHVRAATPGLGVTESNCHPFTAGPYAFMHNGSVAGFKQMKRQLCDRLSEESYLWIHGTTDSEHVFALFRDHVANCHSIDGTARMVTAMSITIRQLVELSEAVASRETSFLNFAVTDGSTAVVSRFATNGANPHSLYYREDGQFIYDEQACRLAAKPDLLSAVVVASEPLNDDAKWQIVPPNHLLVITPDRDVCLQSIDVAQGHL